MFAKFVDGKSSVVTMSLPEGEDSSDWIKVDDSLAGMRLVKDGKKVRAMTDDEIVAEREAAYAAYLAALESKEA